MPRSIAKKIFRPDNDFSTTIQMWYDRIYAYLQLIRMKEGKTNNPSNILQFVRRQHIANPGELTMKELQDSLQFARIRQSELRKQAKGLRKVHLRIFLINLMEKNQKKRTAAIKQTINREESKRMWYLIKWTVKDPHSPGILKVQRVIEGKTQEYKVQEDVKNVIQCECEIRFSLAHSAPIMTTLLGKRLRYLSNEALAWAIITKMYDISSDMDPATKLILEEIGNHGIKLINEEGTEIVIMPEDFTQFGRELESSRHHLCWEYIMDTIRQLSNAT
jgi:hypothetical protein